jgi:two-component system, cell cycle sensor histidine kinase and response regulator CckA
VATSGGLSGETIRALLDIAPDAIAVVGRGVVLYMSPTGARMLGFESSEDVAGRNMAEWLHPEDVPVAAARIGEVIRLGRPLALPQEYRATRQDGQTLIAEVSSVPITYEGQPAVLAFIRDVTERKALERRLAEAERLASLGRLSAGVAHELNNPLAHMMLAVDFLRDILGTVEPARAATALEQTQRTLGDMADNLERMANIARELRSFSGPQPVVKTPVDLAQFLDLAVEQVSRARGTLSVSVERRYQDAPPAAADPRRMEQVFVNLLSNALDALDETPHGRTRSLYLTIRSHGDARVLVEIGDTGPGIPAAALDRLFEPFFTTKAYGKGAGLGLSISRTIVQAHGGTLEVSSVEGEGTTFRVALPTWNGSTEPLAEEEQPVDRRLRVLIVDDEVAVARALAAALGRTHEVVVMTGGRQALSHLSGDPAFDAILCDVVMPDVSGVAFYEALRQSMPDLCRRLVFMTGATLGSDAGRQLETLPNRVLEKPFDMKLVVAALRSAASG